jgi:hypothetical protein
VDILLAALIPCQRTPAFWMALATNYYNRNIALAWFSFGESWGPRQLREIRARRPHRDVNREITAWLRAEPDASCSSSPNSTGVADRSPGRVAVSIGEGPPDPHYYGSEWHYLTGR